MKLAAWEDAVPGVTLQEKIAALGRAGFSGIELRSDGIEGRMPELMQVFDRSSVTACALGWGTGAAVLVPDPALRSERISQLKERLRIAGDLGMVGVVFVPATGGPVLPDSAPRRSPERLEREWLVELLSRDIAPYAREMGTNLLLSPLNRSETHLVNRLDEAVEICRRVSSPALKVLGSLVHTELEEIGALRALERAQGYLGHVHLAAGYRRDLKGGQFVASLRVLERIGYDGYLSLAGDPPRAVPSGEEAFFASAALLRTQLQMAWED